MRIEIDHSTVYSWEQSARYGVQELRLTPKPSNGQQILDWSIEMPGIEAAAKFTDAWGNIVHLANQTEECSELAIRVRGTVETADAGGVIGALDGEPAVRIFLRQTALTKPDKAIRDLAGRLGHGDDSIAACHALMQKIAKLMRFDTKSTHVRTTASEALRDGNGVCQDFAHVFIAASRLLGRPARYVTGYLHVPGGQPVEEAHHAWAETEIKGLGWVGFDPANGICPDQRYVRLACGPDADHAAPLRGLRRGAGHEKLTVAVSVRQSVQQ